MNKIVLDRCCSRYQFFIIVLFLLIPILSHAFVMSNGIYKTRSDLIDSTSRGGSSFISGGSNRVVQSVGQSFVANTVSDSANLTNISGNIPEYSASMSGIPGAFLIDDFEDQDFRDNYFGKWHGTNTGTSSSSIKITNSSSEGAYAVALQYTLGAAGESAGLADSYTNSVKDYSGYSNLVFTIKGSLNQFSIKIITTNIKDGHYYQKNIGNTFANFTSYTLSFNTFAQSSGAAFKPLMLSAVKGFIFEASSGVSSENGWFMVDQVWAKQKNAEMQLSTNMAFPLVDDFEDVPYIDQNGGHWNIRSDSALGGNSSFQRKITNSASHGTNAQYFHYTLGASYAFRFAEIATVYTNNLDYSACSNIVFSIKGNNNPLKVRIETGNILDGDYYQKGVASVPSMWTSYTLAYSSFTQAGWGTPKPFNLKNVRAISFGSASESTGEDGWFIIDNIQMGPVFPHAVPGMTAVAADSNAVQLNWTYKTHDDAYRIYCNTNNSTNTFVQIAAVPAVQHSFLHSDLSLKPNKPYYYWVIASNSRGWGPVGASVKAYTFAGAPEIVSMQQAGINYTNDIFTFTNKKNFHSSGGYAWQFSKTNYSPVMTDSNWSAPVSNNSISMSAPKEGKWYLHVRSYNKTNIPYYQIDYGPFRFFKQYVRDFNIYVTKHKIMNDGSECSEVRNVTNLIDTNSHNPLSATKIFCCEVVQGSCEISGYSNIFHDGRAYMTNAGPNICFHIRGTSVDLVKLKVYWVEDSDVGGEVDLEISPPMDIKANSDSVVYKNVVNPDKGDKIDFYVNADPGEAISVHIYDIMRKRMVREMSASGRYLLHMIYDLRTDGGSALPDGFYGIYVRGKNWKKEMKFVVNRR